MLHIDPADELAAIAFVDACHHNDVRELVDAVAMLGRVTTDGWTMAIRGVVDEVREVSAEIRDTFLTVWMAYTRLSLCVRDDAALSVALRVLLPPYDGPPVQLFRGAAVHEREGQAFGFSWTAKLDIAISYANDHERRTQRPGAVFHTLAMPATIICASSAAIGASPEGEEEFVLDPLRLGVVAQINPAVGQFENKAP
jgi:hypothetical protein